MYSNFYDLLQVTGGSSGIGKALAVGVVKLGANVTILARNKVKMAVQDQITEGQSENTQVTVLRVVT